MKFVRAFDQELALSSRITIELENKAGSELDEETLQLI